MSDPAILFLKPKAISAKDKKTLQAAGVVVIEIDDPTQVKFVRASTELSGGVLLRAAASAIMGSSYTVSAKDAFARAVCAAIDHELAPNKPPTPDTQRSRP